MLHLGTLSGIRHQTFCYSLALKEVVYAMAAGLPAKPRNTAATGEALEEDTITRYPSVHLRPMHQNLIPNMVLWPCATHIAHLASGLQFVPWQAYSLYPGRPVVCSLAGHCIGASTLIGTL